MADQAQVEKQVIEIIANELGIHEASISIDSKIFDDLGADSVNALEIIMALEDEYSSTTRLEEELENVLTVGQLAAYFGRRLDQVS